MGKVYKSAMGRPIDMEALMAQNSDKVALGNMQVNAKGDRLGKNGEVIKQASDVVKEYYENNPKAIKKSTSLKGEQKETDIVIDDSKKTKEVANEKQSKTKKKAAVERELPDGSIEIIEDDIDGGISNE